jgi:phage terminase large subunit GpA-like protein
MVQFSPNTFKNEMAGHLGKAEPGEWYIHAPAELLTCDASGQPKPPHLFFEQLVAETPDKSGNWTKIKPNVRNEALDQLVGTHVVAHLNGLTRINWDKPPNWAAPHDKNSMIEPIAAPEAQNGMATAGPVAAGPSPTPPVRKSWLDRMAH